MKRILRSWQGRKLLVPIEVNWEQCDPKCPGWGHFNEGDENEGIQRCDDCERFTSDTGAKRAHAKECGCDFGKAGKK